MLIGFFRSNQPACMVVLPFIIFLMWLPAFLHPQPVSISHTMPLFDAIGYQFLQLPLAATIVGYCMVLANAFYLNYFTSKQEFYTKASWLPALILGIFMSSSKDMLALLPVQFAAFFLQVSLNRLLDSYRKEKAFSDVFDASLWMGIASLFYFPMVFFILFLIIALIVLRPFIWREWAISIAGFLLPYVFVGVYYFYFNWMEYLWYDKIVFPTIIDKSFEFKIPSSAYWVVGIVALITVLSIFRYFTRSESVKVKTAKANVAILWVLLFSLLSWVLAPAMNWANLSIIFIPIGVLAAGLFMYMRRVWVGEVIMILFFAAVVISYVDIYF